LLEIRLGDAEVDVADIEAMEGGSIGSRSGAAFRRTSSAVLLSLGKLRNNGNAFQFLASQFESLWNGIFVLELNVTNAGILVSTEV
jgi:hypothetical protein